VSTNKRELELSQALMSLQVQYNAIVDENKFLRQSCFTLKADLNTAKSDIQYFKQLNQELRSHLNEAFRRINGLLASVSVLKSNQKPHKKSGLK
jgi:hypothetical protein